MPEERLLPMTYSLRGGETVSLLTADGRRLLMPVSALLAAAGSGDAAALRAELVALEARVAICEAALKIKPKDK